MSDDFYEPPKNLEAERALLGSLLIMPGLIPEVSAIARPDDLFDDGNRAIYRTILFLHHEGLNVDALAVIGCCKAVGGLLDELFPEKGVHNLGDWPAGELELALMSAHRPENARFYAAIIREKAVIRALIKLATKTLFDAGSGRYTAQELLDAAEQGLRVIDD